MADSHGETGGLRWGSHSVRCWNASWPFARLCLTRERITLRLNVLGPVRRIFTVAAGDVRQLEFRPGNTRLWRGLEIHHADPAQPAVLIFWTFSTRMLEGALTRLGYRPIGSRVEGSAVSIPPRRAPWP